MPRTRTPLPEVTRHTEERTIGDHYQGSVDILDIDGYIFFTHPTTGQLAEACPKCAGTGCLPEYSTIAGGACFACRSTGTRSNYTHTEDTARRLVRTRRRDQAYRARKAQERADAREQASNEWASQHPALSEFLASVYTKWNESAQTGQEGQLTRDEHTAVDLARSASRGPLSPAQTDFAETLRERIQESAATKDARNAATRHLGTLDEPLTVSGTVTLTKSITSWYGYTETVKRLVVVTTDDGQTVKMFSAAKWAFAAERGQAITLTGVVKDHTEWDGAKQTVLARPQSVTDFGRYSVPAHGSARQERT